MRWSEREREKPNMRSRFSNTVLSAGKEMNMDGEVLDKLGTSLEEM